MIISTYFKNLRAFDTKTCLWTLVAIALILRLAFVLIATNIGRPDSMDAQNYLRIAANLATGNGFRVYSKPTIFVAPLYPSLIGLSHYFTNGSIQFIKIAQAILSAFTIFPLFYLGKRLFNEKVALIACLLFTFHPELTALTAFFYTETLFIFLLMCSLLLFIKALDEQKAKFFIFAAIGIGLTSLCRGTPLYFPAFLFVIFFAIKKYRDISLVKNAAVFFVTLLIVLTPWTVRNYLHYQAIVPIASGMGDVLWTGNYLPYDGEFSYEKTREKINELAGGKGWVERDRIMVAEAKKNFFAQPLPTIWLMVKKVGRYWFRVYESVPTGDVRSTNWLIFLPLAISHFSILLLAVFGIVKKRSLNIPFIACTALLVYFTLIHAITLPTPRYRQPLIPILLIFASYALMFGYNKFMQLRSRQSNYETEPETA